MKERPILFNAEMVRAILEGRKTQTRRVMKPQPKERTLTMFWNERSWWKCDLNVECSPYGKVGDRLWVRETFAQGKLVAGDSIEGSNPPYFIEQMGSDKEDDLVYRADTFKLSDYEVDPEQPVIWKPSIHMPRWASRINLKITDIRVERVQDIKTDGVWAEGLNKEEYEDWLEDVMCIGVPDGTTYEQPIDLFHNLWNFINGKRGYGWDENPWVWVVEFEVIS